MAEKFRLYNNNSYNVGVILLDKPLGININPHSFTMVTEDDIDYLMSTCTLLQRGILQVDEKKKTDVLEQMGIDVENDANFMSDDDIKKRLGGTGKKMEEWLGTITERQTLGRVCEIAKEMNLSMSKMKILQAHVPDQDLME